MDQLMVFGAEYVIYLTFILMFVLAFRGSLKMRKALLLVLISLPILVLIIKVIHIFYFEPRPFVQQDIIPLISQKTDASFPSRHASIMSAIAFSYVYFKSKWAYLFLALMLWVDISRIYVGVHYPLDILGGFIVGIISLTITLATLKFLKIYPGF